MRLFLFLCLSLSFLLPTPVLGKDHQSKSIEGNWKVVSVQREGQPEEDYEDRGMRVVYTDDGRVISWIEKRKYQERLYELKGQDQLLVITDTNNNGKVDPDERKQAEVMRWSRQEDVLTVNTGVGNKGKPAAIMRMERIGD